ncbi:hypothetical protein [Shewanella frigidimarina]|uniref:Uncharacterized protein n=1 Tax=Shewanella frigidimarina TaxID=56812 RepID=A0A119CYY4_SHEFR|nr:hypothetical protein [Shewanella frigidimarina]KVX00487.1 hypothetical protein AWJ07_20445 [Shewanella frigidimarina]
MSINDIRSGFTASNPLELAEQFKINPAKINQASAQVQGQYIDAHNHAPLSADTLGQISLSSLNSSASNDLDQVDSLLKKQLMTQFSISTMSTVELDMLKFNSKAEDMAISYITKNVQQGLAEGKNTTALTNILDQSAQNYRKAYSNTSSILDKLGKLGPEQQSFISRSEYRVERAITGFGEYQMRQDNAESDKKSFELTLKTQEGDTVTIRFSSAQSIEQDGMSYVADGSSDNTLDSFQLSYEVEGDLSEKEYKAMQTIFANVGELADDYFSSVTHYGTQIPQSSNATLSTDLLAGFNSEQLASIDLSVALWEDKGENGDEFDYSYQFNNRTQEQHLSVERNRFMFSPVKFDITTATYGGQDAAQLAQYLQVMDSNYREINGGLASHTDKHLASSIDMYKTALTSMFDLSDKHSQIQQQAEKNFTNGRQLVADLTNNLISTDKRFQKMSTGKGNIFQEGMSKLADFNSQFKSGDNNQYGYFEVNQQQKTTMVAEAGFKGMKQQKSYDSQTLSGYGAIGSIETKKSERYEAKAVIDKGAVVALDQKNDAERSDNIHTKIDYGVYVNQLIDSKNSATSTMRLIEDIWTQNTQYSNNTNIDYKVTIGEDVILHSVKSDSETSQKQQLIGDVDKLTDSDFLRRKYAPKLENVNNFMLEV